MEGMSEGVARVIASVGTRMAIGMVGRLGSVEGVKVARSLEERCQARSGVLAALARRQREVREGGGRLKG